MLEKPCLGCCVSTGVRNWNAVDYQVDNTEDGVALRGGVCNIPNWYVFHSRNCLNYLDYLGTATERDIKRATTLLGGEH